MKLVHQLSAAEIAQLRADDERLCAEIDEVRKLHIPRRIRKAALALAILLPLVGCQTTRYVKIPCINPDQLEQRKQAEPERVGDKLTGDTQKDVRIIGGSAKELRSWGRGNLDILSGCTG